MSTSQRLDPMLRPVFRILAATFLVVGLLFFAFPDGTIDTLNRLGGLLGLPDAPHLAHRFWLGLGVSYMAVVTALAYAIAQSPVERRLLMVPLAIGKAVSSGTCLLFFVFEHAYFVYLANFGVDASIAIGVLWIWRLTDPARRPADRLGPPSRDTLRAVCEAFLPAGGKFPQGASEVGLAEKLEAHLTAALPGGTPLVALLLFWIDVQPLLFHFRPRRFHSLSLEERVGVLDAMEGSRFLLRRQPIVTLKLLLGLHAYSDPLVARAVGHDRGHLDDRLRAAQERREAGGKGPYPNPVAPSTSQLGGI